MRIPGPALLLPVFLAGCALPPAVTVASLVVDGVSFATTGKSATDHAISAFVHEDCALLRVVEGREICDPDGEVLVALVGADPRDQNWSYDPETPGFAADQVTREGTADDLAATAAPASEPAPQIEAPAPKPAPRGSFADAKPVPRPDQPSAPEIRPLTELSVTQVARVVDGGGQRVSTYAVVGSFRNGENARRLAASLDGGARVQRVVIGGSRTHRVLLDRPVEQVRRDGFPGAWPVRLCTDLGAPPCGTVMISQSGVYIDRTAN